MLTILRYFWPTIVNGLLFLANVIAYALLGKTHSLLAAAVIGVLTIIVFVLNKKSYETHFKILGIQERWRSPLEDD